MTNRRSYVYVELLRRLSGVLLALYFVATLVVPAVHFVGEFLEQRDCAACSERDPQLSPLATLQDDCNAEAPCRDPNHHHHTHPIHDPSHCTLCSSLGTALLERPQSGPILVCEQGPGTTLFESSPHALATGTRRLELARGPPSL